MDQVVQQNAQLVQQAARSANELESEAARLREAVERFSIAEPTIAPHLPCLRHCSHA
jgi:methyl-accepting chemotaxis protein-2 (aspartate sensor receptor)